ncbi:MAG: S-adenosylmethionine:tRNA ribosyltransferase-isomerase [Flavisolibacter sp.]
MKPPEIIISDYEYDLPRDRIAEFPLPNRDQSRLLVYENGSIQDDYFYNLAHYLPPDSTVVLNNTRVIEARMHFQKATGATIELFCLEPFHQSVEQSLGQSTSVKWLCLIGGASKWKPGQVLEKKIKLDDQEAVLHAKFMGKHLDSFIIEFYWRPENFSFAEILHSAGAIPLPPYIKRQVDQTDTERYQTIFAKHQGSVAAPTAALHFTKEVFQELSQKNIDKAYVTLHVGAGTFKPVKTRTIAEHAMHQESFTVSAVALKKIIASKKIIAVGTTSLRTLESIYWIGIKLMNGVEDQELKLDQWEAYEWSKKSGTITWQQSLQTLVDRMEKTHSTQLHCSTSLIIVPGYRFNLPTALITNFHQPQSTLLLLIAAFIGEDWKKVYRHALDNDYRFLSYGDSSLLWREQVGS